MVCPLSLWCCRDSRGAGRPRLYDLFREHRGLFRTVFFVLVYGMSRCDHCQEKGEVQESEGGLPQGPECENVGRSEAVGKKA